MKTAWEALEKLKFNGDGLIPAVIQDVHSGTVLMLAYMNKESLQKTLKEGRTWFFSRSRNKLWAKGETSGHVQKVRSISYDCDADTLLIQVEQTGAACHEGSFSCFSRYLLEGSNQPAGRGTEILYGLEKLLQERKEQRPAGSYSTYLFAEGLDKILKKVGEEATEVVIAAKGGVKEELIYETADLLYHLLVLLRNEGICLDEIMQELASRRK